MRGGGLLVLVLLVGGLGVAVWATGDRAKKEAVPSEALLGGRRLADATRVIVQRAPDAPALHFGRDDARAAWSLLEPIVDLASRSFLDSLSGVLDTAQRFPDGPLAEIAAPRLQQMGLDQPRGRIEVRYPDKSFAFAIGLEGPLHQDLYIAMEGNAYRTGLAVWSAIQANPDDARERMLVQTHADDIRRFALRRRTGVDKKQVEVIELERVAAERFELRQPLRTTADLNASVALLSFLTGMAAEQFLGTLNPMPDWDVQVEIEGTQGSERLTIWSTPAGLIGRQEPRNVEFTIKSVDYSRTFEVPIDDLRARVLVPVAMQDVGRVEIDPGQDNGERIQLRRTSGDKVRMFQPVEIDAEASAVNDLLAATQRLQVASFEPADAKDYGRYGLDRGFLTVSLHPRHNEADATVLHFGREDGEHTFVKRADETFVARVPKAAVDVLRRPWTELVERDVALPVPSDVREIRYTDGDRVRATLLRDDAGKWRRSDGGADVSELALEIQEIAAGLRGKRALDARSPATASELAAARRVEIAFRVPASGAQQALVLHVRQGDAGKQAWVVRANNSRIVVELGVADSAALLAPLGS